MNKFKLAGLLLLAVAASALADRSFSVSGNYLGAGAEFSGELSHFGKFTGHFYSSVKTEVLVAKNGDKLFATTSNFVRGTSANGVTPYSETWTIIAGTGKMAGATGTATVTGVGFSNGIYTGSVSGTVTIKSGP